MTMKPSRRTLVRSGSLLAIAVASPVLAQPARKSPLVVVIATRSPLVDIRLTALRALFLGESVRDPAGNQLVPLNHPPGAPDRVAFDRKVLSMSPDEAGRYWVDRRIRGQGHPPRSFTPVSLLLRLLERMPTAVAYARADEVPATLRILNIDGKRPADPGYPLAD